MRKITVIHPSRGRPEMAVRAAIQWMGMADNSEDIEYIMMCDFSDPLLKDYSQLFNGRYKTSPSIYAEDNKSAIDAINKAASYCTGDLIVVVSDDFSTFFGWDTLLLQEIGDRTDFVLKTKDGIQPMLVTLPIVDRVWYERYGYIYENGYDHMYADQELTAVAAMTGKLLFSDLLFEHQHYSTGKTPMDEINRKNDATYPAGRWHFMERLNKNFDIEAPIMRYIDIQWHSAKLWINPEQQ